MVWGVCIYVVQAEFRDFRHQKLLKHPQTPYSIERAGHKLSKTPSHALIDAVGGSQHHFECTTCALAGPTRTRQDAQSSPGEKWEVSGERSGANLGSGLVERICLVPPGPVWTGKGVRSALKVML